MAHDVFISYSSKDKPTADAVCATLESRGVRCWIAPRDVFPGEEYAAAIVDAIHTSRILVLVFSSVANQSPQVLREVERAVSKGLPILPLRIEDVPPSAAMEYYIASRHWLDALTTPLEQHLVHLADTVKLLLSRMSESSNPVPHGQAVQPVPPAAGAEPVVFPAAFAPESAVRTTTETRLRPKIGWLILAAILVIASAGFLANRMFKSEKAESQQSTGQTPGKNNQTGESFNNDGHNSSKTQDANSNSDSQKSSDAGTGASGHSASTDTHSDTGASGTSQSMSPDNEFKLGRQYYDAKNYSEALKWLQKAAEHGQLAQDQRDTDAPQLLGTMYERGNGVAKDLVTAYMWYLLTANQFGSTNCNGLEYEEGMTQNQIDEAKRRAAAWKAKYATERFVH